jgi:fucokinase
MESGTTAFLQQAYRNNWQQYLVSSKPGAPGGWDLCVLTASDERQAAMYRRQLALRRDAGLLPVRTRCLVLADPAGQRIGSGGATLRVLATLAQAEADVVDGGRVLIIHSGGDSRRLPHCSAIGKLFARIPRTLPDGRASTLFDEFLISLSGLPFELPPGVLVASGDVLLVFDHLQLQFQRPGVIGVAAAAPVEMGTHHGVYVIGEGDSRLRAYLHKPAMERLRQWDAISDDGTVPIDTGLVWLDARTVNRFVALAQEDAVNVFCGPPAADGGPPAVDGGPSGAAPQLTTGLNLYGDLLMPLAESTTLDGYLADTSDGPDTPAVRTARQAIWTHLRGVPFTVERLQPAGFLHFGTSREYWGIVAAAPEAESARPCESARPGESARPCESARPGESARPCESARPGESARPWASTWGWERHTASFVAESARPCDDKVALIDAVIADRVSVASDPVLIVDSHVAGPLSLQGAALLAGICTERPLTLGAGVVVHQLPVAGNRFVTRIFGLYDDAKRPWDDPSATFMNRPWAEWLAEAGLDPGTVWPDLPATARTLWNAQLYPNVADREESLALSRPLIDPASASPEWRSRWESSSRLSLAESFAQADGRRILAGLVAVEDQVAARRTYAAIEAEQPALEVKPLLGSAAVDRRVRWVAEQLRGDDPILKLRGYKALTVATGDPRWEDEAFATLAEMIETAVNRQRSAVSCREDGGRTREEPSRQSVRVEAAARIDFGGGWTDTPPHSIERGGAVLNAAVTLHGRYPIVVEVEWLPEPRLVLESRDIGATLEPVNVGKVLAYANPADPFALLKAALVLRSVVPAGADPDQSLAQALREFGAGLRVSTQTTIPRGSGLGTSSILAGAVLAGLARSLSIEITQSQLFDEVLCLEQMLTTGGGWQDQAGGLVGGIKLVTTEPGLPQRIEVSPVRLSPETQAELDERLMLVYTGQQRLAKNLLRAVMGRWMARDPEMVWMLKEIARLAEAMRDALESGDVSGFGALLSEHWVLNRRMDPGCTNPFIDELFDGLKPYIDGGKLAGAGGGGFVIAVARDGQAVRDLPGALAARYPGTPVAVWPCGIPGAGVVVRAGEGKEGRGADE